MQKYVSSISISLAARAFQFASNVLILRLFGLSVFSSYSTYIVTVYGIYPLLTLGQTVNSITHRPGNIKEERYKIPIILSVVLPIIFSPLAILYLVFVSEISLFEAFFILSLLLVHSIFGALIATLFLRQKPLFAVLVSNLHLFIFPIIIIGINYYGSGEVLYKLSASYFLTSLLIASIFADKRILSVHINFAELFRIAPELKKGLMLAIPPFVMGSVNSLFLLSTLNVYPEQNKHFALLFTVGNLIQIIPNAISNMVISSHDRVKNKELLVLLLITMLAISVLILGGYKILFYIMSIEETIDYKLIVYLLAGSGFLAMARIVVAVIIRAGGELAVSCSLFSLFIILSCLLKIMQGDQYPVIYFSFTLFVFILSVVLMNLLHHKK